MFYLTKIDKIFNYEANEFVDSDRRSTRDDDRLQIEHECQYTQIFFLVDNDISTLSLIVAD